LRRAEAIAALSALLALGAACSRREERVARDYQVGVHQVRLVAPPGWEVIEHGRQHLFRKDQSELSLVDVGPTNPDSTAPQMTRDQKTAYVLGSFDPSDRKEIAQREDRLRQGRVWTEVHTWSRVSHTDPARVAFTEAAGHFLVLATDYGPIEVTGPAFDSLLATIEDRSDRATPR
jgi:hypothetical protein